MRVAMSRWPLPDEIPARVRELAQARGGLLRVRREPEAARPLTHPRRPGRREPAGLERLVLAHRPPERERTRHLRLPRARGPSSSAIAARASSASFPRRSRSTSSATIRPSSTSSSRISGRSRACSRPSASRRDAEAFVRRLVAGAPALSRARARSTRAGCEARHGDAGPRPRGPRRALPGGAALPWRQAASTRARRSVSPASICASSLWRSLSGLVLGARAARTCSQRYRAGRLERVGPGDEASEATLLRALAGQRRRPRRARRCCCSPSAPTTAGSRTSASTSRTRPSRARTRRSPIARPRCCARAPRPARSASLRGARPLAVPAPHAQQGLPAAAREGEALLPAPVRRACTPRSVIQHMAYLARGPRRARADPHAPLGAELRGSCSCLLSLPFLGAALAYDRAPLSVRRRCVRRGARSSPRSAFWYLAVQFAWRRISRSSSRACHASGPASSSATCRSS